MDLSALLAETAGNEPAFDLWQVLGRKGFSRPATLAGAENTLDRAGDQRFKTRSGCLLRCIEADGPDQALYQALMEGLGYSSNRTPFLRLAEVAPYRVLAEAALELPGQERAAAIGRWLLSRSGLNANTSHGGPSLKGMGPAIDRREWHLFRVRPSNHPKRRIYGAVALLSRFLEPGLAAGLREEVQRLNPAKLTTRLSASSRSGPAYVGRGRAKDLAVNAELPFMHAWDEIPDGAAQGAPGKFYQRFPMLAGNEITREMTEQLLPAEWRGAVSNAGRQQGLLHLSALLKGAH